ncbi:hypothetical protein QYM36_005037 [Artemia franciscana]|uniref:Triosephosphate isomerase n=1 Tax=Artemia franciscana TaxID=6661 RepID=A0AA88LBJ9_ARTSF|nr:hypothetical protein QYM36_005037 [Artemia franciscana]
MEISRKLETINFLTAENFDPSTEVVCAPPTIYSEHGRKTLPSSVGVSSQNSYKVPEGAFTGETSPAMIKDVGVEWAIIGHSEGRNVFGEADELIWAKAGHALEAGLKVIPCIGEKLEERQNVVIGYEPVWAIGTGKTASPGQAQDIHVKLRKWLNDNVSADVARKTRIIYGGSVTADNCRKIAREREILTVFSS